MVALLKYGGRYKFEAKDKSLRLDQENETYKRKHSKSKWRLHGSTVKRRLVYSKSLNYAHEGSSFREKA